MSILPMGSAVFFPPSLSFEDNVSGFTRLPIHSSIYICMGSFNGMNKLCLIWCGRGVFRVETMTVWHTSGRGICSEQELS